MKKGRRHRAKTALLYVVATESEQAGKVAFIAPKRLGNAVARNRSKRVLRAAFDEVYTQSKEMRAYCRDHNVIVMATQFTAQVKSSSASEDIKHMFDTYILNPSLPEETRVKRSQRSS